MNLTLTAIRQPVLILMVMMAAVLAGLIGMRSMRLEENPDVQFGVLTITTVYPGAGPEEVNSLISKRIEEAVSGVPNMQDITASSLEGLSSVRLEFKVGTDMDPVLNDVRSRVDTILDDLPDQAERPIVQKIDTAAMPVISLAVSSPSLTNRQLRDLIDRTIKDRISRLEGVSSVGVSGGEQREIQVQLKRDALLRYGLGVLDVQRAIQNAALNVPAGRIIKSGEEYTVRMLGDFDRVESLSDMFLTVSDGRGPTGVSKSVRLGDVAKVLDTSIETRSKSRLNGKDAVIMVIQKSKEGNAVDISRALYTKTAQSDGTKASLLDTLSKQYNLEFQKTYDVSTSIEESISDLTFSIMFGVVLVTLVVMLFLHNIRGTLIVAIAIPLCIFSSMAAYWVFGFTINNLSMLALSLAVGVLVDDAIVIIENSYRHLTMGEDPEDAAINGRMEIGTAAIAITLADVVVFFPIGIMGGVTGQFFKPLGLGYVVCVLFSLMVSFTVTPMLVAKWYKKGEDMEHPKNAFARGFESFFTRFSNGYGKGVAWALKHRWSVFTGGFIALIAVFLFIGGTFAPKEVPALMLIKQGPRFPMGEFGLTIPIAGFPIIGGVIAALVSFAKRKPKPQWAIMGCVWALVLAAGPVLGHMYRYGYKGAEVFKFAFFPVTDTGRVSVEVDLPPGTSITETEKVINRLEKIVSQHPQVEYIVSSIGTRGGGFASINQGTNFGSITATLYEKEALMDKIKFWEHHEGKLRPGNISAEKVAGDFIEKIGKVPGAKLSIAQASDFGFGSAVQLSLQSTDRDLLQKTAEKIRDGLALGAVPGVINPDLSTKAGKPELQAIPNRAKLADADLSAASLGIALRTMYEGNKEAKFRVKGEEYDIRVMLDMEDRNNPALLESVPVSFSDGKPIYLSDVSDIRRGQGLDRIDRRNRLDEVVVQADLLPGYSFGTVNDQIAQWVAKEKLIPPGVVYDPVGQAKVQSREFPILIGTFLTGIILVYMVLAALYNNLVYPFIIQLAQPQALVGALLALVLTDKPLNVVGFIGVIALVGLVGKNAILLVDYANTLRKRGEDRDEAVIHSGRTRLRPILMTTIALIVGTLPVALAIGRGSEFRETIGITIIGGASLSTLLTLFVIPCSYTIFDDLLASVSRVFQRRGQAATPDPAPEAS